MFFVVANHTLWIEIASCRKVSAQVTNLLDILQPVESV